MKWFFQRQRIASEKNGEVLIIKRFWQWDIRVEGIQQSGNRLNKIWKHAIERVEARIPLRKDLNILLLGLGAGGILKILERKFDGCHVTAVEYDPIMISIAKKLGSHPGHRLKIIEGDADDVIFSIKEKFHLIIIDLFYAEKPSSLLLKEQFMHSVRDKLAQDGIVLINTAGHKEYLFAADSTFEKQEHWIYLHNWLGAYHL